MRLRSRLILLLLLAAVPMAMIMAGAAWFRYIDDVRVARSVIEAGAELASAREREALAGVRQMLLALSSAAAIRNFNSADCRQTLTGAAQAAGDRLSELWLTDREGKIVCSSSAPAESPDLAARDFLANVRERRDFALGRFMLGGKTRQPIAIGAFPVTSEEGFQGILGATLLLEFLAPPEGMPRLPQGARLLLVDREGTSYHRAGVPLRPYFGFGQIRNAIAAGAKSLIYTGEAGDDFFLTMTVFPPGDLYLLADMPESQTRGDAVETLALRIVESILLILVVLAALAAAANYTILRPLAKLERMVEGVGRGDPDNPKPLESGPQELRNFSEQLVKMSEAVAERERRLTEAAQHQDLLLREIHHRTKNNLQVISSLLGLQAGGVKDPTLRLGLEAARDRVRALAILHQHMYREGRLGAVSMPDYIADLCRQLGRAATVPEQVTVHCASADLSLPAESASAVGMLIVEAALNSLRHGFHGHRSGNIWVGLSAEGERAKLSIRDDGSGMVGGGDAAGRGGIGLMIMESLAKQLGGVLEVTGGPGVTVEVAFTVAQEQERLGGTASHS